jgi:hypothetical protein
MRPFTENPGAKWLPSRHNLAVFRLLAAIVLMRQRRGPRRPEGVLRTAYVLDRHQSALENFTLALLFNSLITVYFAAWLQLRFSLSPVTLFWLMPLLFILAPGVYQLLFHPLGLLLAGLVRWRLVGRQQVARIQTGMFYLLMTGIALLALRSETWVRWAGVFWLALLTANAAAAVVMLAVSPFMKSLEERMGGGSFDVSYWDSAA